MAKMRFCIFSIINTRKLYICLGAPDINWAQLNFHYKNTEIDPFFTLIESCEKCPRSANMASEPENKLFYKHNEISH